jgi:hypothetical protein
MSGNICRVGAASARGGRRLRLTRVSADEWVTHVGLNALGVSIVLHVAIGRRWPFAPEAS